MNRREFLTRALAVLAAASPKYSLAGMVQRRHLAVLATSGFAVNAVTFDGSTDYLTRGADLTGAADSKVGIFSAWYRCDNDLATDRDFINSVPPRFYVTHYGNDKIQILGYDTTGTKKLRVDSSSTFGAGATWHHILISWNLATPDSWMYIDDSSDMVVDTELDAEIDLATNITDWAIGGSSLGAELLDGDLAEVYFNIATSLDLTTAANRRKFIDAAGKPVDLGSDGSTPTGTAPIIYLSVRPGDAASVFATNKGSGGNLTDQGSIALAATSPSD